MGGSPKDAPKDAPKKSKLAALAAARKQKPQELAGKSSNITSNSLGQLASESLENSLNIESKEPLGLSTRRASRQQEQSNVTETQSRSPERRIIPPLEEPTEIVSPLSLKEPSAFGSVLAGHRKHATKIRLMPISYNPYDYIAHGMDANFDPFSEPSPDDIVAKAQSASKGMKSKPQPKTNDPKSNKIDKVAEDLSKAAISESKPPKSKNLDVVEEFKKSKSKTASNFVVIGD